MKVRLRVTLREKGFHLFLTRRPRIEALRSGFDRLIAPQGPWKVSVSRWSPVGVEAPFHTFAKKRTSKEKKDVTLIANHTTYMLIDGYIQNLIQNTNSF